MKLWLLECDGSSDLEVVDEGDKVDLGEVEDGDDVDDDDDVVDDGEEDGGFESCLLALSSAGAGPEPKTTMLAFDPWGTVTTQNAPPPAPSDELPTISLTLFFSGSIAQGRPLQPPPSHSILTPQFGITSRNGVVGSR